MGIGVAAGVDFSYGWAWIGLLAALLLVLVGVVAFVALGLRALGRNAEDAAAGRLPTRPWQGVCALALLLALASPFMQYPIRRDENGAQEWIIGVPIPWHSRIVDERGSRSDLPHLWYGLIVNAAIWLVTPHMVLRGVLRRRRLAAG